MIDSISLSDSLWLSRIVYGMWRLAEDTDRSVAHVQAKVEACLAQGITSMDQADIYGDYESEAVFGQLLKQQPSLREKIQIVGKCDIMLLSDKFPQRRVKHYDTSAAHIRFAVEQTLSALHTDHLDLLLIHRPDPLMDHHETGQALDAMVASGKVRHIGVSNFRPWDWTLLQSAMTQPLLTNQIELSLSALDAFTNGDLAFLQQHGIRPMAWSPLGGGSLMQRQDALGQLLDQIGHEAGVDRAAVAMAWLLRHPAGILPVAGTNNIERIQRIGDAMKVELSREQWFELYTAAMGEEVP